MYQYKVYFKSVHLSTIFYLFSIILSVIFVVSEEYLILKSEPVTLTGISWVPTPNPFKSTYAFIVAGSKSFKTLSTPLTFTVTLVFSSPTALTFNPSPRFS